MRRAGRVCAAALSLTLGELVKRNLLAKGEYVALGRTLKLKDITYPLYLLVGESDDFTTAPQVFAAAYLCGTPPAQIQKRTVPGDHVGLFMGAHAATDLA